MFDDGLLQPQYVDLTTHENEETGDYTTQTKTNISQNRDMKGSKLHSSRGKRRKNKKMAKSIDMSKVRLKNWKF